MKAETLAMSDNFIFVDLVGLSLFIRRFDEESIRLPFIYRPLKNSLASYLIALKGGYLRQLPWRLIVGVFSVNLGQVKLIPFDSILSKKNSN